MALPEEIGNPHWPPFGREPGPEHAWLRFQTLNVGDRRAVVAAHVQVPYVVDVGGAVSSLDQIAPFVAHNYLTRLNTYLKCKNGIGLGVPPSWLEALDPSKAAHFGTIRWLPIWPSPGGGNLDAKPRLASWNLSRTDDHELPAQIMMVAAEVYADDGTVLSYDVGVTVPMTVVDLDEGRRQLIVRSVNIELPRVGQRSFTEIAAAVDPEYQPAFFFFAETALTGAMRSEALLGNIALSSGVKADTLAIDELRFTADWRPSNRTVLFVGKALGSPPSNRSNVSHEVVSEIIFPQKDQFKPGVVETKRSPLVTHAAPGDAEVFRRTPPGWFDDAAPDAEYSYRLRRPGRKDSVLEDYRILETIKPTANVVLNEPGYFEVRLCPNIVKADNGVGGTVKSVRLPGTSWPAPRRDDFSAISAYRNSRMFFDMLESFGLTPQTLVVRAQQEVQIFYRSGIYPGPGGDGRTINAQVAFDCRNRELPFVDMRFAIAQHNRWARPDGGWAQPLGIATSGRWVLHEFGHYLLAARLGKLEFDFAHSAGDAMAAVFFDPLSRLADTRGGVSEKFRGYTYPLVFTTRRHDREVGLGWAWYGTLNRSALSVSSGGCNDKKGYLTEQILSSSVFRLYRCLGGDTKTGEAPDRYTRRRAAHMTLFLLVRAIAGFGPSPSVAECLELAMETAGIGMMTRLPVPSDNHPERLPDAWEPALTHKTVRWAFEAQGMFPADPGRDHNAPGSPPPVDLFVADQRPTRIAYSSGVVAYGAGSYVPVSLDWAGERLWTIDPGAMRIEIGNRGSYPVHDAQLRIWIGSADRPPEKVRWDLDSVIDWHVAIGPFPVVLEGNGIQTVELPPEVEEELRQLTAPMLLVLVEVSTPYDVANTDPSACLPSAVPDGQSGNTALPTIPRRLADLVANDNNLGLMVFIV